MPAEIVDPVFRMTLRQRLTVAAFVSETSTVIGPRFGVSDSAIRHRIRRGLAKLPPEQREHYRRSINRRRNRRRVTAVGEHSVYLSRNIELARGLTDRGR